MWAGCRTITHNLEDLGIMVQGGQDPKFLAEAYFSKHLMGRTKCCS